jgi:hypothetical protein
MPVPRSSSHNSSDLNEELLIVMCPCQHLTSEFLVPFARHQCPKLRRLGLYMDPAAEEMHLTQECEFFDALRRCPVCWNVTSIDTSAI